MLLSGPATATILSLLPLAALVVCVPAPDRLGGHRMLHRRRQHHHYDRHFPRQFLGEEAITQTVVATVVETATATTYTTVSASDSATSSPSPNSAAEPTTSFAYAAPASSYAYSSSVMAGPANSEPEPTPTPTPAPAPAPATSSAPAYIAPPSGDSDNDIDSTGSATAPASAATKAPSAPSTARPTPLVMAYYPDWAASTFPPENIDFSRFDWIDFAFAVPTATYTLGWDGNDDAADLLRRLVTAAHQNGKHVKLSVGGWTGSKYFSSAVSTPQTRQTFANNILAMYQQFSLDGIDIDWEYPGQQGNGGNIVSPNDTANYLAFLKTLRTTLPPTAKISAATMTIPWADSQGHPMKDVSAFGSVLDWILVMNYDTWGSSSTPGPNAPLSNACHKSTQNSASAVAGVMSWTTAGFPVSKIVLGVPSYGYISRSTANGLVTRSEAADTGARYRRSPSMPMHMDGGDDAAEFQGSAIPVVSLGTLDEPSALDNPGAGAGTADGSGPLAGANAGPGPGPTTGNTAAPAPVMVRNEDGGTDGGQVQFRELVRQQVLQYIPAWSTTSRVATMDDSGVQAEGHHHHGSDEDDDRGGSDEDDDRGGSDDGDDGDDNDDDNDEDGGDEDEPTPDPSPRVPPASPQPANPQPASPRPASPQQASPQPASPGPASSATPGPASPSPTPPSQDADGNTQATAIKFAGQQIINVYNGQNGFERRWDACSSSPYLRSLAAKQIITYDDPQSLEMKAVFAREAGLLGVNMFDIHGDTDQWDLTDGLRRGLGL